MMASRGCPPVAQQPVELEMRTWSEDNPKAGLMQRKRTAIVDAARACFLNGGYAQTSMDRIAELAGVSVKTVYRHYQDKDELFSAVMQAACEAAPEELRAVSTGSSEQESSWFSQPPKTAFPLVGEAYLRHLLSEEQLALYRVVTRDAGSFPELARRYHDETVGTRNRIVARYLDRWKRSEHWKFKSAESAANVFAGLLTAGIFGEALHGIRGAADKELTERACKASSQFLILLSSGGL
jgi:TetR/AcrR family transcriptional repressor of mexJK operon